MSNIKTQRTRAWLASFLLLLSLSVSADAEELIDGIAAQVGSDIVLISEVFHITSPLEETMRSNGVDGAGINQFRAEALERLIEQKLLSQLAERNELEVSDDEVDSSIATIARENGITLEQLRRSVEVQELSYAAYRERIRTEIQRAKILSSLVNERVRIEEDEIKNLYAKEYGEQKQGGEELFLKHIMVTHGKDAGRTQAQACSRAEQALANINNGQAFNEIAQEYSDIFNSQGAEIGWIHREELASWMSVVDELKAGNTSSVIKTPFGCNLLQVVKRRNFEPLSYEQAKDELYNRIFAVRSEEEYLKFVESLRERTYIERKGIFARASRLGGNDKPKPVGGLTTE